MFITFVCFVVELRLTSLSGVIARYYLLWKMGLYQARNPVAGGFAPLEQYVGHSLKYLGPSQKTLRSIWCPNLVAS